LSFLYLYDTKFVYGRKLVQNVVIFVDLVDDLMRDKLRCR
jgi:hypothetical protein